VRTIRTARLRLVPVTVENSWAFGNGYAMYGTFNPADGNGNGFKMGSSATGIRHLVQNNVAWKNKANGFYANHSTGGNTWYNNTSFMNGTQYNMLASPAGMPDTTITLTGSLAHIMRNNIGYPNKNTNMTGVDTMFNTWDLNITPAAKDFASQGFRLVGGRIEYLDDRPVAALVYQRRQHFINLFTWPSSSSSQNGYSETKRSGYNLVSWSEDGMTCWAVSDLQTSELEQFAQLYK